MHVLARRKWIIAAGLSPALLVYVLFAVYPILQSFYYSLMSWDGLTKMEYVGFDNFVQAFQDPLFWSSVRNNMYVVAASVFGQVPLGLFVALLLNRKLVLGKFFRTVGFLPVVISTVIISLIWGMIYNSSYGLLNQMLKSAGLGGWAHNWLSDPDWAMIATCITIIWQYVGFYLIIFLAALQNVPSDLYEAAKIDGASEWMQTWRITIPLIWDTVLVAVILCISGSLRTFDLIYVMTGGGPAHTTEVMAIYMFQKTFSSLQYGYGNAISILIFVFSLILIVISRTLLQRKSSQG